MHKHTENIITPSELMTPGQWDALPILFETFLKKSSKPNQAIVEGKDAMANIWLRESFTEEELKIETLTNIDDSLLFMKNFYQFLRALEQVAIDEHFEALDTCM